jgi:site-specific DNA recombinase
MAIVTKSATERNVKRAALYSRVSDPKQKDGTSLQTQEAACRKYAAEYGYTLDDAHVFVEVHTRTELWERPALTRLREAIRHREVDVVIVYAIDRLARDPVHLWVILTEAEHARVEIEFVTEPLDDSQEGQLIRYVRGYAAKVEHEKIKERSIRGKRARIQAGKLLPGNRPRYGFHWCSSPSAPP